MFPQNLVLNGLGGDPCDLLLNNNLDTGVLRPYRGPDGRGYVTLNVWDPAANDGAGGMVPKVFATNTPATLPYDAWKIIDQMVMEEALPRLRVWGDLAGSGLQRTIPNAFGKTIIQHQTQAKVGAATISMDGVRESERARPVSDLGYTPLPMIHEDFSFTARELAVAANGDMPLDATMARMAFRNVAETVEDLLLGTAGSYEYGGAYIYGLTNFPSRITVTLTNPTAAGWGPETLFNEILGMLESARTALHYGPFGLYFSTAWTRYLDADYTGAYAFAGQTLRSRINMTPAIRWINEIDRLTGFQVLLVPLTTWSVELINGMPIQVVQWETKGGMVKNWKVMCIMVPRLRADVNGNAGIVHGVAP
jgi:hypothetical protein